MSIFTAEELNSFTVIQLRRLADYYGVKLTYKHTKAQIAAILIEVINKVSEPPLEYKVSVRIQRIRELNRSKENG